MNIVFSSTRQWNPGDEFILMGCINLLRESLGTFNPIIYNRNPQIRRARKYDIIKGIDNILQKDFVEKFLDNSVKDRLPLDYADLIVFAGSPEWIGKRLSKLYKSIIENNIPCLFLGIGSGKGFIDINSENFSKDEIHALKQAKLITCRDCHQQDLAKNIFGLNIHNLPCPALFSSLREKEVKKVKKIGLIYGSNNAVKNNNVSTITFNYLLKIYKFLLENYSSQYDIEFIAHYIDELSTFKQDFPNQILHYSYDSKEYLDLYNHFDLVIGHRVHGIGISASLGIPGIMISHDKRSRTVKGFDASIIDVGTSIEKFEEVFKGKIINISDENKKLLKHKKTYKSAFLKLLPAASLK